MKMLRSLNRDHLFLISILALAAFFRLYRVDEIPPGFQFDQAYYVFDSLRLLQGQFHIFFATPGATEPLFPYLAMVGVALFGVTPLGLKLTSAIVGVVTIPLVFGLARSLFQSTRIGLLAAFFTAVSIWHIFYGRYGERIQLLVLFVVLMFWFFWRAIDRQEMRAYRLAGLFLGLGLDTNVAARMLPFALAAITGYMVWTDREHARVYIKGLLWVAGTSTLLFMPLVFYFMSYPDQFFSHTFQVSIFTAHGSESGDILASLIRNGVRLLEMFFIRGDEGMIRNVPNRPIFDPVVASLFIVGLLAWTNTLLSRGATALARRRAVFLFAWMVTGLLTSLISDDAPNFSRLHPIIPLVMMLPAWGASEIWDRLSTGVLRNLGMATFGLAALATVGFSYRDYFISFGQDPGTYYAFNGDRVELANWVNQNAHSQHLFLAPVALDIATVSLLTRDAPLKSFESRDTIVLPSRAAGKDALYAFPVEQEKKARTLQSRLGAVATLEQIQSSRGAPLLYTVRVPAVNLPEVEKPLEALAQGSGYINPLTANRVSWSNGLDLLGYTLSPEGPGGRNVTLTLFLQGFRQLNEDYIFSIKVRDDRGRVWGQEDKWAGNNSYATTKWGIGDVVVEKFYPGLNACAPPGRYVASVEAYNPKTMQVAALVGGLPGVLPIGEFQAGPSEGNLYEHLEPEHESKLKVTPDRELFGYTLSSPRAKSGGEISLSLFWRGSDSAKSRERVLVRLQDSMGQSFVLSEKAFALPGEGRGLCTLFDLTVPVQTAHGTGQLLVNENRISSVNVER